MAKNYVRIGSWYHYVRRVPRQVAEYDTRTHVRIALKTKDEKEAMTGAAIYDDFIEKYWKDLVRSGQKDTNGEMFNKVRAVAKAHGFAYKNIAEVASSPLDEILSRVEAVSSNPAQKHQGLLGSKHEVSGIRLEDCPERFWPLCADRFTDKNDRQIHKYKNPRLLAVRNFVSVVGNIELARVERSHVLELRNWLMARIANEEIGGDASNKQMSQLRDVLQTVATDEEIDTDFDILFARTRFQKQDNSVPPFETAYFQNILLDGTALGKLRWDRRIIFYMMVETGARQTELITLDEKEDIFLDEPIPYIWIRKNKHWGLKTNHSERKIPLTGVSLMAAREFATCGIERIRHNPDSVSTVMNKDLLDFGIRPTPEHTLNSVRHSFKDRLRAAGTQKDLVDELMGHKEKGPKYGSGYPLEVKHTCLQGIAFKPPKAL